MFLAPGDSGGPETYLRELVRALAAEYPNLRMTVLTTGSGARALAADGFGDIAAIRALPAEEYRRARRQLAEQLLVQIHARRAGADLLHSLASTGPVVTPGLRSVVTLHDVTFMHTPTFGRVTTWGMTQVVSRAARDADALIAVSAAARDDICATLGLDPAEFTVVPHGIGEVPRAEPVAEQPLRERLRLGAGRLVLCVAAVRPHKNQELLVRALPRLPDDVTVVLAGRQEPYAERVRAIAAELGVEGRLRLTGFLEDGELERLWTLAAVRGLSDSGGGLRPARARGDGPRRAGRLLGHPRPARGGRRRAELLRPLGPGGGRYGDRGGVRGRRPCRAGHRARPWILVARRRARDHGGLRAGTGGLASRAVGYFAWHEQPGYWRDVTRHFAPGTRLLDVGCGGAWLGDHFSDYTGVDVSPEAVEAARSRGREVVLVEADGALPFDDASFDGVVLKDVLEHVPDPVAVVREARRVLRDGGRVFASSPDAQRWVWDDYTHRRPFTRKSFRLLFEDQGLNVETVELRVRHARHRDRVGLDPPQAPAARCSPPLAWLPFVRRNVWLVARR